MVFSQRDRGDSPDFGGRLGSLALGAVGQNQLPGGGFSGARQEEAVGGAEDYRKAGQRRIGEVANRFRIPGLRGRERAAAHFLFPVDENVVSLFEGRGITGVSDY